MKMKSLMAIAGAIVVLGAVTSYLSPHMTLHSMRSDIIDKDADGFSSNVDFPAFRESLRAQIMTVMQTKLSSDPQLQQNPFADIGMMLGASVVTQFVDTMVTPAGVMHMMDDASSRPPAIPAAGLASTAAPASESSRVDYSVSYRNWSTVAVTAQRDRNEPIEFIFKRNGLWSWKLSGVTLPPSATRID
ncbi:DUF2939 domain-containing protein [Burkholderia sp. 4701]|nr:DUF2939 domain-containing protein [Burkholderia sp. 4701]MXN81808.1 DUF2939 domain-containing protein [Burkholderia sp. 4812]